MPKEYVAYGNGYSGDYDTISKAQVVVNNNGGLKNGDVYVRLDVSIKQMQDHGAIVTLRDLLVGKNAEIERLQERMTKMEILLTTLEPEWETAPIFTRKPFMTDEEIDAIFGGYK